MASIRHAKRRAQESTKRNLNLSGSKIRQAGRYMAGRRESNEDITDVVPKSTHEQRNQEQANRQSNALVVQQREIINTIDRQLAKMAAMNAAQQDMIAMQKATQKSSEWLNSETTKFTSGGTTVLYPEDLKNIRKIVQEELKNSGGSGGSGIPSVIPSGVPGGKGGDKKTRLAKIAGIGMRGALGAAGSGFFAANDLFEEKRRTELEYQSGQITAEERDARDKESNYKATGKVVGGAIGTAAGGLLGPIGAIAGGALGSWAGGNVGEYFSKTPVAKAAQQVAENSAVQRTDIIKATGEVKASSSAAIAAISKASEKFEISKDEMLAVAMQESSMNPNAVAKKSNAVGLFQFLPSTWNNLLKKNPDIAKQYGIGEASRTGNDDRTDPMKSAVMYALLRKENMAGLKGSTTGDTEIDAYLMHLLGGPIGKKVINAYNTHPKSSIKDHVKSNQYEANRELMEKNNAPVTVSQFVANIKLKLQARTGEVKKFVEKLERTEPSPQEMPKEPTVDTTKKPLEAVSNIAQGVDINGLSNKTKNDVTNLANEYLQETGEKLNFNSAYRSFEKQSALYAKDPSKAAKPGTSIHETGMAVDIDSRQMNKANSMGLLSKNDLVRPISTEPWHVESEGARASVRKKSDVEERINMTAQVNREISRPSAPTIINAPQSAPQVSSTSARPTTPMSTRNNDSTYQALKIQELSRSQ